MKYTFGEATRFIVLQFLELGGDHLDLIMHPPTLPDPADEGNYKQVQFLLDIRQRSLTLLKDARKTLYFLNANSLFVNNPSQSESPEGSNWDVDSSFFRVLVQRIQYLNDLYATPSLNSAQHQILLHISRLPLELLRAVVQEIRPVNNPRTELSPAELFSIMSQSATLKHLFQQMQLIIHGSLAVEELSQQNSSVPPSSVVAASSSVLRETFNWENWVLQANNRETATRSLNLQQSHQEAEEENDGKEEGVTAIELHCAQAVLVEFMHYVLIHLKFLEGWSALDFLYPQVSSTLQGKITSYQMKHLLERIMTSFFFFFAISKWMVERQGYCWHDSQLVQTEDGQCRTSTHRVNNPFKSLLNNIITYRFLTSFYYYCYFNFIIVIISISLL